MKTKKAGRQRGFRPKAEAAKRIDEAEQLGMNLSELINQALSTEELDRQLANYKNKLRAVLGNSTPQR